MTENKYSKANLAYLFVLLLMVGIRIWLIWGMPKMIMYAPHDDLYYAKIAHYIANGQWMGPYDEMTLIKAPFYAFFLIASSVSGLSLFVSETLFYVGACFVFFFALRPLIKNRWARLLILTFLVYAPLAMPTTINLRVYREFVYLSLSLYIVAFAVGFILRLNHPWTNLLIWSIGLGLSIGAFLITREDGMWIFPIMILLLLCCLILIWLWKLDHKAGRILLVVVPIMLAALPTLIVFELNYSHYGFWGVTEQLDPEFQRVLSLMSRIEVDNASWSPTIQISRAQRNMAYQASPLLKGVQSSIEKTILWFIDGSISGQQMKPAWYIQQYPVTPNEIGNSHFPWALRMAVAGDGFYSNATTAHMFYKQVADQLEAACNDGRLKCRSSFSIPIVGSIDQRQDPLIFRMGYEGGLSILKSRSIKVQSVDFSAWEVWPGAKDDYVYFDEFTHNPVDVRLLNANADAAGKSGDATIGMKLLPYQHKLLAKVAQIYARFSWPLSIAGFIAWLYIVIKAILKKERTVVLFAIASTFTLAMLLTRLITLSIVDATTTISGLAYGTSILLFAFLFFSMTLSYAAQDLFRLLGSRSLREH